MSNEIKIKIDGIECVAQEGEYILNIARANNIFIPALCYLTRCSPTLACRICLVEADGKRVYSCNVKAKDGMDVITNNDEIAAERKAIMQVYDVNHPLQCGVCDKSGECELQNYSLYQEVDTQEYAIADTKREVKDWSDVLHYDAGLCIVCERCTTVCKDMIGEAALKTTKRGGDALPKELKEQMPKDAYAMWNKLQKSIIAPSNGETTDCADCGECISVCPTGAIVSRDFQYKSNAWELSKVPATCAHCSVGCQLNYEVKHTDIANSDQKIYRVTNEFHYVSLCGAGRFGYDFENKATKDSAQFEKALEAFKKCETIVFDSFITNEEAYILQQLKENLGVKLVNSDAKRFGDFMQSYALVSGKNLYSGDLKSVFNSDFVISVGSFLRSDSPNSRYAFNNVQKLNKGAGIYFHPVADKMVESFGKNVLQVNHGVGNEDAVLYLILDLFAKELPSELQNFLDGFKYDSKEIVTETIKEEIIETAEEVTTDPETGEEKRELKESKKLVPKKIEKEVTVTKNRLLEIVGAADSFEADLEKALKKKENFSLILGEDLIFNPEYEKLAQLAATVEKYTDFNVVVIPPKTNSLGVSLICDLDEKASGYTVGYNQTGDFVLSATGEGDLDMPALNQQEGTFVNINKKVVPTNAAVGYEGYTL
ncbi:MAG: NADH-quinone oxidoreductase subunit G, partial [Campylobacterota bacterium]